MAVLEHLPVFTALLIVTAAVLAGPVLGIPEGSGSTPTDACKVDSFPGNGNASVTVTRLPDTARFEQARFGAEVWRLHVPNAGVNITDIEGQPTVAYKIIIHELTVTTGSSTILSRCHNTTALEIPQSSFEPKKINRQSYNATLKVVYRGRERGEKVERELASKNITIEVEK